MTIAGMALGIVIALGLALVVLRRKPTTSLPGEDQVSPTTQPVTQTPLLTRLLAAVDSRLARAGWAEVSAAGVVVLWGTGSVVVGAVVMWVVPLAVLGPLTTVATMLAGAGVLRARIERRERALRAVWPGLVDHLRQAVRSGAGVGDAVWALADVVPGELRPAFVSYQQSLEAGHTVSQSLTALKADIANPVADRIIEALRMAHEVGGPELPRILSELQTSVRADWQVREDALAKQAWIRAASKLGVAAPWIVLVLISGRPETQSSYSEPAGIALLVVGAVVSGFAFKLMQKLGTLPQEKRWLA
jgi:tight adherence protein B